MSVRWLLAVAALVVFLAAIGPATIAQKCKWDCNNPCYGCNLDPVGDHHCVSSYKTGLGACCCVPDPKKPCEFKDSCDGQPK